MQVDEDGGYLCLDVVSTSGKTLLALGSLLTGAKVRDIRPNNKTQEYICVLN